MHDFQFGDIIENGWASDSNPTKRGVFIHYKYRAGRMNPGKMAVVRFDSGSLGAFPIDKESKLTKVGTIFDADRIEITEEMVNAADSVLSRSRPGIPDEVIKHAIAAALSKRNGVTASRNPQQSHHTEKYDGIN